MTDHRRPIRVVGVSVSGRDSAPTLVGAPEIFRLNETALAIWDLCDGATTVDEMVDAVVELGLDDAQARADVQGVVDEFERLGVITASGLTRSHRVAAAGLIRVNGMSNERTHLPLSVSQVSRMGTEWRGSS